ncbi:MULTISPECIES: hypothetical protein [unclassified Frankia]
MLPVWPFVFAPAFDRLALQVKARWVTAGGPATPVAPRELRALLSVTLVQGTMGRLLYLIGAEKARLRCAAREVSASRAVANARRAALDRHGADLGAARFGDRLLGRSGLPPQVFTGPRTEPTGLENDEDYRRRLLALRAFSMPTPAGVAEAVNGSGGPQDRPRGWLGELGATRRVRIVEQVRPYSVGLLLMSASPAGEAAARAARLAFLAQVRRDRLVLPASTPATDEAYRGRLLPPAQRAALEALGSALRAGYFFDGDTAGAGPRSGPLPGAVRRLPGAAWRPPAVEPGAQPGPGRRQRLRAGTERRHRGPG